MPVAARDTVARVAAMLRPHRGRQANLEAILNSSRWHRNGHWLEKNMEAFFQRNPGADPVRLLAVDARRTCLLDEQTSPVQETAAEFRQSHLRPLLRCDHPLTFKMPQPPDFGKLQ
ncbi:hypothetical protein ColLi_10984 [Colletotrichum liriopes]|uniref:Uncharacterized protein n=1 Tax=Colletotrichum liriopes TaxID=708192 RepID=A0AA37GXE8_9PEZI|nr:hypothetical protein ColLi_10984 [Colletotrichum liriopes]